MRFPWQRRLNAKPAPARLELATGILWLHTHVNEPAPALDRLSYDQQTLVTECFLPEFSIFAGDCKWRAKLASGFKFATPSDSTPQKRPAAARARAAAGVP